MNYTKIIKEALDSSEGSDRVVIGKNKKFYLRSDVVLKALEINSPTILQDTMNEISEWSDSTFGINGRNPGIAYHLKKEVDELIDALKKTFVLGVDQSVGAGEFNRQVINMKFEFADCFMLLLDSANHAGLTADDLISFTKNKLLINKTREWGNPDENGVCEHIRK